MIAGREASGCLEARRWSGGKAEGVESMASDRFFGGVYRGLPVLVTGHTGFKGSWLTRWLTSMGADVTGYALPPDHKQGPFVRGDLASTVRHVIADVRDASAVARAVKAAQPRIVFHLAAQPLVRKSYNEPVDTIATNVMGTVHVMEAVRKAGRPCALVVITSDKCYENREWLYSYRENDPMGGHDAYSASKGAAEIMVSSYRRAFFHANGAKPSVALASVRAGNVIGPGDWCEDRIVVDAIRSLMAGKSIPVRNPHATRPWQHVLEPLSVYLWVGAKLLGRDPGPYADAWNFGPRAEAARPVSDLVDGIVAAWGAGKWIFTGKKNQPHEASFLSLNIDKAVNRLPWSPVWDFDTTVRRTVLGYRALDAAARSPRKVRDVMDQEISAYCDAARGVRQAWARHGS